MVMAANLRTFTFSSQLLLQLHIEMIVLKLMPILAIFHLCLGNIFLVKLSRLIDNILLSHDEIDSGTLLGIAIAKGQLQSEKNDPRVEELLKNFQRVENKLSASANEISKS